MTAEDEKDESGESALFSSKQSKDSLDTVASEKSNQQHPIINHPKPTGPKTKASFLKLPEAKNQTAASGLVNVVQEQADNIKAIHIMPRPPSTLSINSLNQLQHTVKESQNVTESIERRAPSKTLKDQSKGSTSLGPSDKAPAKNSRASTGASKQSRTSSNSSFNQTHSKEKSKSGPSSTGGNVLNTKKSISTSNNADNSSEIIVGSNQVPGNSTDNPDSFLQHLRNKKSSIDNGPTTLSVNSLDKLTGSALPKKRAGGMPSSSILNLRAAIGQATAGNSTSSTSIVQGKRPSRAEFFAAKLHDAIKDDETNKSDSEETFVYDMAPKRVVTGVQKQDNTQESEETTKNNIKELRKNRQPSNSEDKRSLITGKSSAQNSLHRKSSLGASLNLNIASLSSTAGNRISTHANLNNTNISDSDSSMTGSMKHLGETPLKSTLPTEKDDLDELSINPRLTQKKDNVSMESPKPHNHLREITSRIFDSKGVTPRKYSGTDMADFNNDEEDYEDAYNNIRSSKFNSVHTGRNQFDEIPFTGVPSTMDYDSDIDDDFSVVDQGKYGYRHGQYSNYGTINSTGHGYGSVSQTYGLQNGEPGKRQGSLYSPNEDKYRLLQKKMAERSIRNKKSSVYFNPHDFTSARTRRIRQLKSFCYTMGLICLLLSVGFMGGFILATSKELQNTTITGVDSILISDEEFMFDMNVQAFNPGVMSVTINSAQLDIFAKTQYIVDGYTIEKEKDKKNEKPEYTTVLLGSVDQLDMPLSFQGGCFTRQKDESSTEIKIINPCTYDNNGRDGNDDDDGDDSSGHNVDESGRIDSAKDIHRKDKGYDASLSVEHSTPSLPDILLDEEEPPPEIKKPNMKWLNISRNPFELIVRGVLNYQLMLSSTNKTVAINYKTTVNPDEL